jgi:hypothetical protein
MGGESRGRSYLEELGIDGKIILKLIFKKWDGASTYPELIWLRIETSGELL